MKICFELVFSLFSIFYFLFSIFYFLFSIFCFIFYFLFSILYSLFSILCSLFSILYSLFSISYFLFFFGRGFGVCRSGARLGRVMYCVQTIYEQAHEQAINRPASQSISQPANRLMDQSDKRTVSRHTNSYHIQVEAAGRESGSRQAARQPGGMQAARQPGSRQPKSANPKSAAKQASTHRECFVTPLLAILCAQQPSAGGVAYIAYRLSSIIRATADRGLYLPSSMTIGPL